MKKRQIEKLLTEYDVRNCRYDAQNILDYVDNMKKELEYTIERLKKLEDELRNLVVKSKGDMK